MAVKRYQHAGFTPPIGRKWLTQASVLMSDEQMTRFRAAGNGDLDDEVETSETALGIVQETKLASDTTTDKILVQILRTFDEVLCKVTTGTMAATEIGDEADYDTTGSDGITLTESNNDFTIVEWNGETDEATCTVKALYYGGTA